MIYAGKTRRHLSTILPVLSLIAMKDRCCWKKFALILYLLCDRSYLNIKRYARLIMYDVFFDYLKRFSPDPLSDNEKALITQTFVPSRLRKRQFLLQEGELCRYFAFIVKGAMRMYSVDEKGTEHFVRL